MKPNLFSLISAAVLCCQTLFSQVEFMPVGSTLISEVWRIGFFGTLTYKSEKDTIINGERFKKIVETEKEYGTGKLTTLINYVQQKGDSIFTMSPHSLRPYFAFKNRFNLNDSLVPFGWNATIYIDSIDRSNGVSRYVGRAICGLGANRVSKKIVIYDKFGINGFPSFDYFCQPSLDFAIYPICYQDPTTFYRTNFAPLIPAPCDSLRRTPTTEFNPNFSIFPNPANQSLKIHSNTEGSATISICDMRGVELLRKQHVLSDDLDVSSLPNGLYFLIFFGKNRFKLTKKIVIRH